MGLLKTAARAAVAAHVVGTVRRRQDQRWAAQDAAAAGAQGAAPLAAVTPAPPVQAPPPAAPAPQGGDLIEQLERLGQLRAAGVLTDAEFEAQKARILAAS